MESDAKAVPVNKNKRHEKEKRELQCGCFTSAVSRSHVGPIDIYTDSAIGTT
jgi:hypothetical protein